MKLISGRSVLILVERIGNGCIKMEIRFLKKYQNGFLHGIFEKMVCWSSLNGKRGDRSGLAKRIDPL